jgi:hypothetical protein
MESLVSDVTVKVVKDVKKKRKTSSDEDEKHEATVENIK